MGGEEENDAYLGSSSYTRTRTRAEIRRPLKRESANWNINLKELLRMKDKNQEYRKFEREDKRLKNSKI